MRERFLTYIVAACINLAIVSGTLATPAVERVPIVRVRQRMDAARRFAPGETAPDGSIVVSRRTARAASFSAN